jgi:UDP-2,3-diacylglucosamine pyrophosphatase LpxH
MTYDAVFISDVHLGTDRCNTQKFLKFLKEIKTKMVSLRYQMFKRKYL